MLRIIHITRLAKSLFLFTLSLTLFGTSMVSAQDLLPRDNGIMTYHQSPRWRESESHPLRVLAYVFHPVGWVAREAIFRPISAFAASTETTRSVMGFREPFDFRETVCFDGHEEIPNCRAIAPYANKMKFEDSSPDSDLFGMEDSRQVFIPDVNFEFDKANLNDLGKGRVRQIAQLLETMPEVSIVVEGHTDYKGTDEYNMKLGERRAQTVISELVSLGIPESRLSPISYGEGKPVFTEETDWARAVNRRVQFAVGSAADTMEMDLPPANN
jgi:outer membrane protein OmpA-like peptidoglycan-associated protein